jgi:hypothetical protein
MFQHRVGVQNVHFPPISSAFRCLAGIVLCPYQLVAATGYVFWIPQEDKAGTFEFEGRRYAFLDIEDYVLWSDEETARRKYDEVCKKARGA